MYKSSTSERLLYVVLLTMAFLGALVPVAVAQDVPGDEIAATSVGTAERYWLRIPSTGDATLWLFVGGSWRQMANPSRDVQDSVQEAFCNCHDLFEVVVGYEGGKVEWVVVRSKIAVTPGFKVKVINMIPASLSAETGQDSEPFLALDLSNPNNMAGSAFTRNPSGGQAPIYVSLNGGNTWALNASVPSDTMTGDITIAGTSKPKRLHTGILKRPGNLLMNILRTDDFIASTTMSVRESRSRVDQPFVQAKRFTNTDRIYVGNNDFNAPDGKTATIDMSLDDGATYQQVRIEPRATAGQDGPSIRPTVADDGTVYAAYFGWRSFNGSIATSDIVVVRDDKGGTGTNKFQDLKDPSDSLMGRLVVKGVQIPWSNAQTLGRERIGSTLSIAVHPKNSRIVYVGWADRVGDGDIYSIHVRRSTDRGATWSGDLRRIRNATPFALSIADNGTVGFLYQQFTGTRWVTHLEQSKDAFSTVKDTILADVPGNTPAVQFLPFIGDYNYLLSSGKEFRGIFSTNNEPDKSNFPNGVKYQRNVDFTAKKLVDASGNSVNISVDPFYFSVSVLE